MAPVERLGERVVLDWRSPRDLARKLERIADKEEDVPGATWGTVTETDGPDPVGEPTPKEHRP